MPPKDRIHHVISGRVNRSSGLSNTATRVGQMSENIQNLLAAPNPLDSSLAESPPAIPDFTASTETASTRPASIATAPLHTHLHPQVPNRSAFAELFGDDHPDVPHLYGTGRSGFTPILINYPTPVVSALERAHRNAELALQQKRLEGWTSHELLFMYAMERPGAIANDLSNPIHPLLTRDQWNVSKNWPLGAGFEGCWDIKNPIVWEIMQPILRLATQFLTNTHILTWFDALIFGKQDFMPCPPAPKANYLPRIHRRSIMERYVSFSFEDRDFLVTLIGRIGWCLDSGDDFSTVRTDGSRNVAFNGCTEWKGWPDAFQSISIAWQNLEPLLTSVLSESRRLLVQFQVAKTIVHELCHAVDHIQHNTNSYFEDELQLEIGRSFENAVFGGYHEIVPRVRPGWGFRNQLANITCTWPSLFSYKKFTKAADKSCPPLEYLPAETTSWSIPILYVESLGQQAFWDYYVPRFGAASLRPFPQLIGLRFHRGPAGGPVRTLVAGVDYLKHFGPTKLDNFVVEGTPWDTVAQRMERKRTLEAGAMAAGLRFKPITTR